MANKPNTFINIYYNETGGVSGNVGGTKIEETPDRTSGNEKSLSSDADNSYPLSITINSSKNEAQYRKLGIRTEEDTTSGTGGTYKTTGPVVIKFTGTKAGLWKISDKLPSDGNHPGDGDWKDEITINPDGDESKDITYYKNTLFWVQVSTELNEDPVVDTSVSIVTMATIAKADSSSVTGTGA